MFTSERPGPLLEGGRLLIDLRTITRQSEAQEIMSLGFMFHLRKQKQGGFDKQSCSNEKQHYSLSVLFLILASFLEARGRQALPKSVGNETSFGAGC